MQTMHLVVITSLLLFSLSAVEAARDDVLIIVNDNSIDSPELGAYYAEQRDIDAANIVHVRVPDSYFISWGDFRRLRDQLIHFMQVNTLDDPALEPVVCTDGEPPLLLPGRDGTAAHPYPDPLPGDDAWRADAHDRGRLDAALAGRTHLGR